MKKQIFFLLFGLMALVGTSQPVCQAYFYTSQDSTNLYMNDMSMNVDSSVINVVSWQWTLSGMGLNFTYSTQNPSESLSNLPDGSYLICLNITTATTCTSSYCDSITIGSNPVSNCSAYFGYSNIGSTFSFDDYSSATSGHTIISWDWTFQNGTPATSALQNPVVVFPTPNSTYLTTLTITTDLGCTETYTGYVNYYDSLPCINYVDMDIYHVTVAGGNDGAIDLTVYGGSAPYQYSWTNGATTEDVYGLSSGVYTAVVWSADSMCSPYTVTANVLEPYDSANTVIDTLFVNAIDSCLGFVPDSFYIGSISTSGNIVTVVWIFTGAGQTATITVDYTFSNYGTQVVVLSIQCNSSKTMLTYMSYIYIHSAVGVDETSAILNVYPNPASNQITLPDGEIYNRLRVIGMDGSILLDLYNPTSKIDVSSIPEGIYIIMGESSTGVVSGRLNIVK
jgi:hypothetical protein